MQQSCNPVRRRTGLTAKVARTADAIFALDGRSLAAFRIGVGLIVTADALLRCRDFMLMFTPTGMFPLPALRSFNPSWTSWSANFLVDAAWWDAIVLSIEATAGLLLAIGFSSRLAAVVAWIAVVSVVRRTAPATNAGDLWLTTLLLWGIFLPLGDRWSVDALRRAASTPACRHLSIASAALMLQVLVVYVSAGTSKLNESWLSGRAVANALSVHDHGTPLGEWLAGLPAVAATASVAVLALELLGPLVYLVVPRPAVRTAVVAAFVTFHGLVAVLMTVGLFAPIGLAAWLALVPTAAWDRVCTRRSTPEDAATRPRSSAMVATLSGGLLALAALDAVRVVGGSPPDRLPAAARGAIDAACLWQDWAMFGNVSPQRQWAYARALLADGSEVDLLRDGRTLERDRPAGGYTSLPHHRWHKLLWELPKPGLRVFSPSIARAIAEDWNRRQPPSRRATSVEICCTRLTIGGSEPGVRHELVVASWPPRDRTGVGGLERWLDERQRSDSVSTKPE